MKELKVDLREMNRWFRERFPNKDLITLEELLSDYENLILEEEHRKEKEIEEQQLAEFDEFVWNYDREE